MTPTFPTREPDRTAPASEWRVLMRLPDVSEFLASRSTSAARGTRITAAGGIDYRFDPPQSRPGLHKPRTEIRTRVPADTSPILPASDPFAIPARSVYDSVAPFVRFCMLVALFTAVGTWVRMSGQTSPSAAGGVGTRVSGVVDPPSGKSSAAAPSQLHPSANAPTAAGPMQLPRSAQRLTPQEPTAAPEAAALTPDNEATDAAINSNPPSDVPPTVDPATDLPTLPLTDASGRELPKIQVVDPPETGLRPPLRGGVREPAGSLADAPGRPPAIARLTGDVLEAEPRHATNDDNQSSLH